MDIPAVHEGGVSRVRVRCLGGPKHTPKGQCKSREIEVAQPLKDRSRGGERLVLHALQ